MDSLRLRLKIGSHEFEAEGRQDAVLTCFEHFRRVIHEHDASGAERHASPPLSVSGRHDQPTPRPTRDDLYAKVMGEEPATGVLALRICPQTADREADALLLLLLGYLRGKQMEAVPVMTLTKSLAQSGYQVKRVDRLLSTSTRAQHVLKAGRGKGGRYRLTSQGVRKAEAIARDLAQLLP